MFERFTEKARRVIFFGRFEASQFGSPFIDVEHLLLASLREDDLLSSLLPVGAAEEIRQQIERLKPHTGAVIPTSADLPLSAAARQVLMFAMEEADRCGDKIIDASCLLVGMLRLEDSLAATLLQPYGINLVTYRHAAAHQRSEVHPARVPDSPALAGIIASLDALLQRVWDLQELPPASADQKLRRKPWSRKEALGHLIDWATAHHQLFARALNETTLTASGYPADNWAVLQHYSNLPLPEIVDIWESVNRLLIHVLCQIKEDKLGMPCRIGIAEPIPLEHLVKNYLDHVEEVLGQILTRGQAG